MGLGNALIKGARFHSKSGDQPNRAGSPPPPPPPPAPSAPQNELPKRESPEPPDTSHLSLSAKFKSRHARLKQNKPNLTSPLYPSSPASSPSPPPAPLPPWKLTPEHPLFDPNSDAVNMFISFLIPQFLRFRMDPSNAGRAFIFGITGIQGVGKTAVTDVLCRLLNAEIATDSPLLYDPHTRSRRRFRTLHISLDDLCLPTAELNALAAQHPGNEFFRTPGLIGTHAVEFGASLIAKLAAGRAVREFPASSASGDSGNDFVTLRVPKYDKTNSKQLPRNQWEEVTLPAVSEKAARLGLTPQLSTIEPQGCSEPVEIVIVEGWLLGFRSLGAEKVAELCAQTRLAPNVRFAPGMVGARSPSPESRDRSGRRSPPISGRSMRGNSASGLSALGLARSGGSGFSGFQTRDRESARDRSRDREESGLGSERLGITEPNCVVQITPAAILNYPVSVLQEVDESLRHYHSIWKCLQAIVHLDALDLSYAYYWNRPHGGEKKPEDLELRRRLTTLTMPFYELYVPVLRGRRLLSDHGTQLRVLVDKEHRLYEAFIR